MRLDERDERRQKKRITGQRIGEGGMARVLKRGVMAVQQGLRAQNVEGVVVGRADFRERQKKKIQKGGAGQERPEERDAADRFYFSLRHASAPRFFDKPGRTAWPKGPPAAGRRNRRRF